MKIFKLSIFLVMAVLVMAGAVSAAPARIASITDHIDGPVRVAVDSQGNLYVTQSARNAVAIYNTEGKYQRSFSVPYPLGIAVDASGTIYVGSGASGKRDGYKNAVHIFTPDLVQAGSLGGGAGEFKYPNDIAVGADGKVYVADTQNHVVKVFDPATGAGFSFGGFGSTSGLFKRPTGVAVNDTAGAAGEVYVADYPVVTTSNGATDGARIQVFDKNGQFLRSFGQFGNLIGQITSPVGVAVDKAGLLYVTDSYQNVVHVLNPSDGSLAGSGGLYDPAKPLYNPMGVAAGKNGIVYVVSFRGEGNKGRIDVYALDGYVTMAVDPLSLTFIGTQYAGNPDPQTVVIANTGSGTLNWSATADQTWIKLGKQDPVGPKSAGGLAAGVNISAFGVGTYKGTITIDSGFGQKQAVGVTLSVVQPPILNISNGWLNFTARKGTAPAAQRITLGVDNLNGPVTWGIASDSPSWLTVSPASGTISSTALTAAVTVSANTTGLKVGSYSGLLTVNAPGAIGTGGKVTVNLTVTPSTKIKVNTNRPEAKFSLTGPVSHSGSGAAWSVEDIPAGDYTVSYEAVAGYRKPKPQTKTVHEDGEVVFTGDYVSFASLAARRNVLAAKGPAEKNDSLVKAYKNTGVPANFDLTAFSAGHGANIAAGDVDGDGVAELIVGSGPKTRATARIYRADKTLLLEFTPFDGSRGVKVAVADLDGDGAVEVVVVPQATDDDDDEPVTVKVYSYQKAGNRMEPTGIELAVSAGKGGVNIAAADVEGDGKARIITATSGRDDEDRTVAVTVWKVDASKGLGSWTAAAAKPFTVAGKHGASIAGGDFDGDGKDELVLGTRGLTGAGADVVIIKSDGVEQNRFSIPDQEHGIAVAAADLDGDGVAEAVVGAERKKEGKSGKSEGNDGLAEVRIYSAAGQLQKSIAPFETVKRGINVAVGELGL